MLYLKWVNRPNTKGTSIFPFLQHRSKRFALIHCRKFFFSGETGQVNIPTMSSIFCFLRVGHRNLDGAQMLVVSDALFIDRIPEHMFSSIIILWELCVLFFLSLADKCK